MTNRLISGNLSAPDDQEQVAGGAVCSLFGRLAERDERPNRDMA